MAGVLGKRERDTIFGAEIGEKGLVLGFPGQVNGVPFREGEFVDV